MTSLTARKIAQEEATQQLATDIQCLKSYEAECQKGAVSTDTFAKTMTGASVEAQNYAANIKNGTGSVETFKANQIAMQASLEDVSIGSRVAAAGLNLLKVAWNSLIFFAAFEGLSLLIKWIDKLIITADEAEDKAKSLKNSLQSFWDEVRSGQQTISSISDRFDELSEHVAKNGENIDLTKDEYAEYIDICNQVKSIMPELVSGYTDEGNAIITLRDNVDSLTESYKENIRAKAATFITNGDDDGNTIQSFFDDYKIFTDGEHGLFAPSAGGLWNNKSTDYENYYGYDQIHEWLEKAAFGTLEELKNITPGTIETSYLQSILKDSNFKGSIVDITEENYETVHDILNNRLTLLEGEMTTRVDNIKMGLQQMLYADKDYWDIDDKEVLSSIDTLFNSVDSEFIKQNNLFGQDALQSFESNIIKLFKDQDTQQAMLAIYAPQKDDENIDEYVNRVDDAINTVQTYADDHEIILPVDFSEAKNDADELKQKYDDTISRFGEDSSQKIANFLNTKGINNQEELDYFNEITKGITNADEAIQKYTEDKNKLASSDSQVPKSVTETISAIDELKTNMSGLDSIMAGFVSGDKLDVSNLNSVLSKLKELKEAEKDIDMSSAENAIKQISDASSIDEAQPAINSLCTQLVYASGILDNVNEADAKLIATRLEGIGITNSSELVEQSLTRQRAASEAATLAETGAIQNLNWEKSESIDTAMASISAIAQETTVTDYAKAALFDLIAQETIFNNTSLDVSQKISALGQLAAAFGVVADSAMTAAGWSDDKTVRAMRHGGATDAEIQAYFSDRYTKQIQAKFANLTPPEVKWGGGSSTNSAKNKSGSGSGSSKDKTTEKQAETFNWMERMLEVIANQHDKINDYVSDETKSIDVQQAKLSEIIAIDQQKMDVLKQQIEVYKQYWLKALSEIDEEQLKIYGNGMSKDDLISKITNGALDIQDFVLPEGSTDAQESAYKKLVEGIKNAQSAYQDVEDTEKKLDDTEQDIADHQKERYEKRIEQIEAENDALKSRQDIIQADLDLLEASGGIELEGMYQELIDLSKQQMSLYEEEAAAARDRMSEVEAGSTEYYQLESKINDCTQSIKECQKEQAEWQETIKRLPIERIQKYINMLQNIKQDLQNFIDEQNSLGISTTVDQYKQLMDISQKEIDKLLEQQKKLSDLLGTYQYGSEKFNDVQDEIQDIDDTISGLIQNMYEWNNSIMQIPIDQLSKVNEQLNLYSNSLGEVLDNYDSVLSAVTGTIDQQIDKINEMRDATEKAYEEKIKPIQEELDLLQKTNDARDKELALEQAKYDREKAQNQKSNKVIRNGEISYEADQDSIREADQQYQEALYQKKVFDLEQQISGLEEERDKLLENYDDEIDRLGKISDKWGEIKDKIQLAADTIKATDLFGADWQNKILSGKDDDLYTMFKNLYESTSTEKDKVDEQIASNERIVTMMQRFVELYQDGSITYEKAMAGITQMAAQMKDGYSALEQLNGLMHIDGIGKISDISASTNAKVDESVQLLGEYMGIAKANSDTISQYTSTWNEMKDNIAAQLAQLEKMAKELEEYVKNHTYSSGSSSSSRDHDSGSSSSSSGGSGNNYVAAGPGYSDKGMQEAINRGDRIEFNGSGGGKTEQEIKDTYKEMIKNKRHSGVEKGPVGSNGDSNDKYAKLAKELGLKSIKPYEYPAFLKQGEIVFTQEQMKQMGQNLQALSTPKYMTVPDNVVKRTDQSTNIDFKMGDVVLNNVQNVDGFAKAVGQTFKSKMRQELTVQRW